MPSFARTRSAKALATAFAVGVLLVGCTGQQDPSEWSDSVRRDFIAGCDGTGIDDERVDLYADEIAAIAQPTAVCECVVDELIENVEFSELKDFTTRNRDLPPGQKEELTGGKISEAYETCGGEAGTA